MIALHKHWFLVFWSRESITVLQHLTRGYSFSFQIPTWNTHVPSHSEDLSGKHLGLSGKYMLCLENLRFADIQNDDDDKLGKTFCNDNRCWLYLWVCSCTNLNNIPSTMHHLWPKLFCRKMHPDTTKQCHAWRRCLANNVNLQSVVSCLNLLYVVSCCLQIYKMII